MSNNPNLNAFLRSTAVSHWKNDETGLYAIDSIGTKKLTWNGPVLNNGDGRVLTGTQAAFGSGYAVEQNYGMMAIFRNKATTQYGAVFSTATSANNIGFGLIIGRPDSPYTDDRVMVYVVSAALQINTGLRRIDKDGRYCVLIIYRAGSWELYVNGYQLLSTNAGYIPNHTGDVNFGSATSAPAQVQAQVVMEDMAFFNRALTESEIDTMMKLAFLHGPSVNATVASTSTTDTITASGVRANFPIAGYSVWASSFDEEEGFDFTASPLQTNTNGLFSIPRSGSRSYAVRAYDDRTFPNFSDPVILSV